MRTAALTLLLLASAGGQLSCAGHSTTAQHAAHHAQEDHAAHKHDAAESLKPLMHRLLVSLAALQGALQNKDQNLAAQQAQTIAGACGGHSQHVGIGLGPHFSHFDQQLHQGAEDLAGTIKAGDLALASQKYQQLAGTCVACHAQAPKARKVLLGRLIEAP